MRVHPKLKTEYLHRLATFLFAVGLLAAACESNTAKPEARSPFFETKETPLVVEGPSGGGSNADGPATRGDDVSLGHASGSKKPLLRSDLEAYFAGARKNPVAVRTMKRYFDGQPALQSISHEQHIQCHGWVCKTEIVVKDPPTATRLQALRPPEGVDFSYSAVSVDYGKTTVTIFSALRGVTLEEVVASASGSSPTLSEEKAAVHAARVEAEASSKQ